MMKKVWLVLLAVVLVFGLVVSCGGGGDDDDDKKVSDEFTSNLSGFTTQLVKNQYAEDAGSSRGLQAKFNPKELLNGYQIKAGDTFTLQLKFKVDKTLAYPLEIGFVDTTVGESEGYWRTLTWDNKNPADSMYKVPADELIANAEIEKEIEFTAVKGGSSAAAAANSLVFECRDAWTKDPVTITFVSFILLVNGGGDEPPPPPPPPPTEPTFDVKVGSATVQATAYPEGGEVEAIEGGFVYTAETPNYQANYVCFSVDLGAKTLGGLSSVTFTANGTKGDTNYKNLQLWAKTTKITGGVWSGAPQIQLNATQYTSGEQDITLEFDASKITTLGIGGESQLYFVIYWGMGSAQGESSYQITDIVFVEGDPVEPPPPPPPPPPPASDDFFVLGPFDDGEKTWATNGVDDADNDLTEEIFAATKYLILYVDSVAGQDGFGGIQVALQGAGNSWGWAQYTICGDWSKPEAANGQWDIAYSEVDSFYIIVDLATLEKWEAVSTGGGAKLILNLLPEQLAFRSAYLTSLDLVKPATALDITNGWAAQTVPEMDE